MRKLIIFLLITILTITARADDLQEQFERDRKALQDKIEECTKLEDAACADDECKQAKVKLDQFVKEICEGMIEELNICTTNCLKYQKSNKLLQAREKYNECMKGFVFPSSLSSPLISIASGVLALFLFIF